MTEDIRRQGLDMMKQVYGWDMPADLPGDFYATTVDHLFAKIWSRPGLSIRDRRLLLLGAVTAQGAHDIAEIQIESALNNGELDADQLREVSLFLTHYVGWPNGSKLDTTVGKVLHRAKKKQQHEEDSASS